MGEGAGFQGRATLGAPMVRSRQVALKTGFHGIEIDHHIYTGSLHGWTPSFDFEWEGPGMRRRASRGGDDWHLESDLDALAKSAADEEGPAVP